MAKGTKKRRQHEEGILNFGGLLGGLGSFIEKLGELAEKGEQLQKSGELKSADGKVRGIYGFNVKVGIGERTLEVEPFGNVGKDEGAGQATVSEVREPMVDVFEEEDHVLVVAEMPGVSQKDIRLELKDDILTIVADKDDKKYRKEVLLPESFEPAKMSHTCRNGVLRVKLTR